MSFGRVPELMVWMPPPLGIHTISSVAERLQLQADAPLRPRRRQRGTGGLLLLDTAVHPDPAGAEKRARDALRRHWLAGNAARGPAVMAAAGERLAQLGWVLRSGGAVGADQAFERGCYRAGWRKAIVLPWPGFDGHPIAPVYGQHDDGVTP